MRRETPSIWRSSSLKRCVPLVRRARTARLHFAPRTPSAPWSTSKPGSSGIHGLPDPTVAGRGGCTRRECATSARKWERCAFRLNGASIVARTAGLTVCGDAGRPGATRAGRARLVQGHVPRRRGGRRDRPRARAGGPDAARSLPGRRRRRGHDGGAAAGARRGDRGRRGAGSARPPGAEPVRAGRGRRHRRDRDGRRLRPRPRGRGRARPVGRLHVRHGRADLRRRRRRAPRSSSSASAAPRRPTAAPARSRRSRTTAGSAGPGSWC